MAESNFSADNTYTEYATNVLSNFNLESMKNLEQLLNESISFWQNCLNFQQQLVTEGYNNEFNKEMIDRYKTIINEYERQLKHYKVFDC